MITCFSVPTSCYIRKYLQNRNQQNQYVQVQEHVVRGDNPEEGDIIGLPNPGGAHDGDQNPDPPDPPNNIDYDDNGSVNNDSDDD